MATFTARVQQAEHTILNERAQSERLRRALDDATQDISRATYGRRREISLRMALLIREEQIVEDLRRWIRRANEALAFAANLHHEQVNDNESIHAPDVDSMRATLGAALSAASEVLSSIDGQPRGDREAEGPANGSVARLVLAQDTLASLVMDLQNETEARLALMRQLGTGTPDPLLTKTLTPSPNALSECVSATDAPNGGVPEANDHGQREAGNDQFSSSEEHLNVKEVATPTQTDGCSENLPSGSTDTQKATLLLTQEPDAAIQIPSIVFSSSPVNSSRNNPELIGKLDAAAFRYENIQRQLRECQRSLATLKSDYLSKQPSQSSSHITQPLIMTVIERLDDYAEDAIVEVEIRAADDTRLAEGFKTLLSVSGSSGDKGDETAHTSLFEDIEAFLDESHVKYGVNFAKDNFMRKVDDLQHDIATVKFALHQSSLEDAHEMPLSPVYSERPGWSRWFSSPKAPSSRPTSPGLAHQSFGAVMTSPTLRSSSSLSLKDTLQPAYSNTDEMIKQLDFRTTMPFHRQPFPAETGSESPIMAPWARTRAVSLVAPRPRAVSGTLGLGASSTRYDVSKLSQSHVSPEEYNIYDDDEDEPNDNSDVE